MRRLLAALAALFIFAALSPQAAATAPAPVLWGGAIGRLQTPTGLCTFFIIRRDEPQEMHPDRLAMLGSTPKRYLIVSAGHCHSELSEAQIGPRKYAVFPLGYASLQFGVDLMLGAFYSREEYRVLDLAPVLPAPGSYAMFVGFPQGALRTVVARVDAVRPNAAGRPSIVLDVALSPGASGGPVMRLHDQKVIGVMNMRSLAVGSVWCGLLPCRSVAPSYAVPIGELRAFLQLTGP